MDKNKLHSYLNYEVGKKCLFFGGVFLMFFPEKHAIYLFRKSQYHASQKGFVHKILKKLYQTRLVRLYGIIASPYATIGRGLRFVHPTSIVIGGSVVAGQNLHLYQNTTLGGARIGDVKKGNQPHLGDNVTVFSGGVVLGGLQIGDNVTIAANSTLLRDVPNNSLCVRSPARII